MSQSFRVILALWAGRHGLALEWRHVPSVPARLLAVVGSDENCGTLVIPEPIVDHHH